VNRLIIAFLKAGILSGTFYIQFVALFATAGLMALFPNYGHLMFGTVSAACFFFPGLKYHRQRIRSDRQRQSADARSLGM
jgi:serine/threonine-protein kinase